MTHATSLPQSANAFWKLPDRIDELDEGQRAEQFAAFLKARVSERSGAPEIVPAHSKGLPALPARSRSADDSSGTVAPPQHDRAHEVSRGSLPPDPLPDQARSAALTEGPEVLGPNDEPPEPATTVSPSRRAIRTSPMPGNGQSDPTSRLRPSSAESGGRSTPLPGRNPGVRSKFPAHLNPKYRMDSLRSLEPVRGLLISRA